MTDTDDTIEDLSALEQYLKNYDNKNSLSFTGNEYFLVNYNYTLYLFIFFSVFTLIKL